MREIKLRVWNKKDKQYTYFDLHSLTGIYHDIWDYINEESIQRFIGIKDKNGKEIYEGDIIEFKIGSDMQTTEEGEIFYNEDELCYHVKTKESRTYTDAIFGINDSISLREILADDIPIVIGNIYEQEGK